jgi:signal recognition particle subunit SRP54
MRQQLENFDEREIDRTEAIIRSMTPAERRQPKLLNGSRRLRIAKGSGMTVTDVNSLVNRFEQAAKMMKTVAKGGVPQMPGMPNMPGMGSFGGSRGKSKDKGKKGSKSGNPAKRAAEEAARLTGGKPGASGDAGAGSAFGLGN